jgi:hypothetical protein
MEEERIELRARERERASLCRHHSPWTFPSGRPWRADCLCFGCPAASVFFDDPDGNLLEYIFVLPNPPRPELGSRTGSE